MFEDTAAVMAAAVDAVVTVDGAVVDAVVMVGGAVVDVVVTVGFAVVAVVVAVEQWNLCGVPSEPISARCAAPERF